MATSVSLSASVVATIRARSIRAAWVKTTPLAGPVVPDVNNRNDVSSPLPRRASAAMKSCLAAPACLPCSKTAS